MTEHKIRAGDAVHHIPSGEDWLILWADYESGYLAPAGWPSSEAKIADCKVIKILTDEEHNSFLDEIVKSNHPPCQKALRMYRPQPVVLDPATQLIADLAAAADPTDPFAGRLHQIHTFARFINRARALVGAKAIDL